MEHLFYLTSGLKSQILAEDQIITQVKDALALSREAYCTDNVLEVLFRMAVTAAKKVKTQVSFSRANSSVIHQAIERLEDQGFSLQGKTCMVIGNGEMGKVTALALKEAGADVTVTVRQYRSGIVTIPQGCDRINYGERLEFLAKVRSGGQRHGKSQLYADYGADRKCQDPRPCGPDRPGSAQGH